MYVCMFVSKEWKKCKFDSPDSCTLGPRLSKNIAPINFHSVETVGTKMAETLTSVLLEVGLFSKKRESGFWTKLVFHLIFITPLQRNLLFNDYSAATRSFHIHQFIPCSIERCLPMMFLCTLSPPMWFWDVWLGYRRRIGTSRLSSVWWILRVDRMPTSIPWFP